jgi:hypothetical protein
MSEFQSASESSTDRPEVVNLSQVDADVVSAEMVRMHQSLAQTIESDDVEMSQSAAAVVNAQSLSARQAAMAQVMAEEVDISQGAVGALRADLVNAQGYVGAVIGNTVTVEGARVGVAAAREVRGGKVESVVLFAGRVEGEVHTVVDTRGAVIAGLVGGLIAGMIFLVGRIAFRRD